MTKHSDAPDAPDAAAVAASFGLGRARGRLQYRARGDLGRIHLLEADGRWAVKELTGPIDHGDPEGDVEFQEAALAAGVPLPRPRRAVDGRVIVTVPTEAGRQARVRLYEWLDLDEGAIVEPATAGALLARIHSVHVAPERPVHPWYHRPVGVQRWGELLSASTAAPWIDRLRPLVQELSTLEALLQEDDPPAVQRCHLDVNPENVLVRTDGEPVVLDWENSGAGDPHQELAMSMVDFDGTPGEALELLAGYRGVGGDDTPLSAASFAMAVAVQGHLVELHLQTWLSLPDGHAERARAEWRLREIWERPLTRRRIDELVATQPS